MVWITNREETIFKLKNNDLDVRIHRTIGLDGWFLSCNKLGICQKPLKAEDFNEAVRESQTIVLKSASRLYDLAGEYAEYVSNDNKFKHY